MEYGKILLGTAGSWFMLDVAYYGLGLNTTTIYKLSVTLVKVTFTKKLYNSAAGNLILVCAGSLPGYWVSAATIDTVGRKPIQMGGFILLTIILCIMGFGYHKIGNHGLLGLFVIAQFSKISVQTPLLLLSQVNVSQLDTDLLLMVYLLPLVKSVPLLLKLVLVLWLTTVVLKKTRIVSYLTSWKSLPCSCCLVLV